MREKIQKLIKLLDNRGVVYIQTHDYPDYDSVSASYALQYLLKYHNIESKIVFEGDIHRESLVYMIDTLNIDIRHNEEYSISPNDSCIIVDGCFGNRNVTCLVAKEVAVLDHHVVEEPENVDYVDIRSTYGACATIVYDYFTSLGIDIPQSIATALAIGISKDTNNLTRGVSEYDLEAYRHLYNIADQKLFQSVVVSYIQIKDLQFYHSAIEKMVIAGRFGFCYFADGCSQNLLGILADFFMGLRGIDFVALCSKNSKGVNFSVRSKRNDLDASRIIRTVLKGVGYGGGHRHMAGGSIKEIELFDVEEVYSNFCKILNVTKKTFLPQETIQSDLHCLP